MNLSLTDGGECVHSLRNFPLLLSSSPSLEQWRQQNVIDITTFCSFTSEERREVKGRLVMEGGEREEGGKRGREASEGDCERLQ